jgi:hypothetical protein
VTADEHGTRSRLLMFAVLGLGTVFLCTVHQRILTYVCGNDPMLYIRAARTLLAPALYGPEADNYAHHPLQIIIGTPGLRVRACFAILEQYSTGPLGYRRTTDRWEPALLPHGSDNGERSVEPPPGE